jgi:hypothetical protein
VPEEQQKISLQQIKDSKSLLFAAAQSTYPDVLKMMQVLNKQIVPLQNEVNCILAEKANLAMNLPCVT